MYDYVFVILDYSVYFCDLDKWLCVLEGYCPVTFQ